MGLAVTVGDEELRYLGEEAEDDAGGRGASSRPASMCAPACRRKLSLNEALLKSKVPKLEPMLSLPRPKLFGDALCIDRLLDFEREASASGLGVQAARELSVSSVRRRLGPGVALRCIGMEAGGEFCMGVAGAASDPSEGDRGGRCGSMSSKDAADRSESPLWSAGSEASIMLSKLVRCAS